MYNVYAYYNSVMFVYFNCLLFKSISLPPFLHFITFLPFFPLLPFLSLLPFPPPSLLVRFSTSFPFHFTPSSFPTPPFFPTSQFPPVLWTHIIIVIIIASQQLLFPNSSPSFLFIPPFLARLLPVQPLISFLFLH